ncbi:MAG: DNA translocase FtsK 4TM domain-containing protein [Pseudomonadota bacterium]
MSYDGVHDEPVHLLPNEMQLLLQEWLTRGMGAAMLVASVVVWLMLVSWQATDPSLTQAVSSGEIQNLLGSVGAIVSDILLQSLGLAAVLMLIGPIAGGLQLMFKDSAEASRVRPIQFISSVMVLTGGLAALPKHMNWPLEHGYGGFTGDFVLSLCAGIVGIFTATGAGFVAGVVLLSVGGWMFVNGLGIDWRQLRNAWLGAALEAGTPIRWPDDGIDADAPAVRMSNVAVDRREPSWSHAPQDLPGEDFRRSKGRPLRETLDRDARQRAMEAGDHVGEGLDDDADDGFDSNLSEESRKLAARFAPQRGPVPEDVQPSWRTFLSSMPETDDAAGGELDPIFDATAARDDVEIERRPRASVSDQDPNSQNAAPGRSRKVGFGSRSARRARDAKPSASPTGSWAQPSLGLLTRGAAKRPGLEQSQTVLRGNARLLEDTLADFGVKGEVREIMPGPVITLFAFEPARGVKVSRVIGLADDIARSMSASSARISVIPGSNMLGIELPNQKRETVYLRDILEAEAVRTQSGRLPIALGKGIDGNPIAVDLAAMPHLLVAGTTGSGKSVGVNAMILSLLYRFSPADCRLLLIDPKMLELSVYNGIPHLLTPVVTDPGKAVAALNWAAREMEERYKRMADMGVRNIAAYNNRVRGAQERGEHLTTSVQTGFDPDTEEAVYETRPMQADILPHIVIVVDEFADLMSVAGKEIEGTVQRLAQMARAAGLHLIMATQRPSVDVVTGTIKANFPSRIAFKVASKVDSRTIINQQGAEQLLGQGDMLLTNGGAQPLRVHGAFVSDTEIEAVAAALRDQGPVAYVDGITDEADNRTPDGESARHDGEDLFDRAVAVVMRDRKASISYVQRRLQIGYNRAATLIERMEADGLISAPDSSGRRQILSDGPAA